MDSITQRGKMTPDEIFVLLKQFITEVVGEEFASEMNISKESRFTHDLEMDSIEIVAVSEKIKKHFGPSIDFTGWLSGMSIDELISLNMNDIILFIAEHQQS